MGEQKNLPPPKKLLKLKYDSESYQKVVQQVGAYDNAELIYKCACNFVDEKKTALLEMAAKKGSADAFYDLGANRVYYNNDKSGAELVQKASDLGHLEATMTLHFWYKTGKGVISKDEEKEKVLWLRCEKLAEEQKDNYIAVHRFNIYKTTLMEMDK